MVWKQDLAQLKQQLKPDQEPTGPLPKPTPPPRPDQSLEDADLLFLRAMGGVAVPPPAPVANPSSHPTTPLDPSQISASSSNLNIVSSGINADVAGNDFNLALGDLKGLRPLPKNPVFTAPASTPTPPPDPTEPPPSAVQQLPPGAQDTSEKVSEPPSLTANGTEAKTLIAPPEMPHPRAAPVLMHLAAGMAIEVDGTLDLRRHSLNDAKERLTERIRDGLAMKWRTILVTLGPNEALKQGFLAFLTTPQAQFISRYAQAPIPMGGAQAWVLYLGQQPQLESKPLRLTNLDDGTGGPA